MFGWLLPVAVHASFLRLLRALILHQDCWWHSLILFLLSPPIREEVPVPSLEPVQGLDCLELLDDLVLPLLEIFYHHALTSLNPQEIGLVTSELLRISIEFAHSLPLL